MLKRWHDTRTRSAARARARRLVALAVLLVCLGSAERAHAQLTVQSVTWDVIGLDSNDPSVGPDTFQSGVRACNTGGATLNNLVATHFWDSANIYVNLNGTNPLRARTLSAGACLDFYFPIRVTRTSAAYNTTRRYHITVAADGVAAVSTPTPREIYVEKIISQGRNTIMSITGPTNVFVGQTYQYTLSASTATQGYEQLEAFLDLPNVVFQVQSISTTYTAPAGATNDKFYADACGWNPVPGTAGYRSCVGPVNYPGGKVGGSVVSVYTVKILSSGATTASALILDFSGSSYHYNNDFGAGSFTINALDPQLTLAKTASPAQVTADPNVTYTLRVTNAGSAPYSLTDFVDTPPTTPGAPVYVAGSSAFNGASIADPTVSGGTLMWAGSFVVPAGQSRDLTYQMTLPAQGGTYTNSAVAHIEYTQVDTTPSAADNAPATASVVRPPPHVELAKSVSPAGSVLPGGDLTYTIAFTNDGGVPAGNLVVTDPIPADTDFKLGSAAADLGTTGLAVAISYSNDGGASWTYTPASGAGGAPAGHDRNVTHVRWVFTGDLGQAPTANTGSVSFTVRVR
jgi:uncharacterized repeat protein (TIGR01451 family)